jgi:ferredoxin
MEGPLPVVSYTACDSCGICVEKCPTGVFRLLEDVRGMKTLEVRGKGKFLKD